MVAALIMPFVSFPSLSQMCPPRCDTLQVVAKHSFTLGSNDGGVSQGMHLNKAGTAAESGSKSEHESGAVCGSESGSWVESETSYDSVSKDGSQSFTHSQVMFQTPVTAACSVPICFECCAFQSRGTSHSNFTLCDKVMPELCMFSQATHHDRLFHRNGLLRGHLLQRSVLAQQTDCVLQSATSADQSAILLPVCCRGMIASRN